MTTRLSEHLRRATPLAWLLAPWAALGCGPSAPAAPPVDAAIVETHDAATEETNDPDLGEKWVRLLLDPQSEPLAMETAIVRYVPADAVVKGKSPEDYDQYVDLVGAVHIGDKRYYRDLNRRFKGYDAVLYELVAPEGTKVPRGRGTSSAHPLGALQNGMKSMLDVEHQLEQVDYTGDNMVHADLSPDEFLESMTKKEEGFAQMYFRLLGASMAQQSQATASNGDFDFMSAMFAKDRPRQLKLAMAKQFEGMETLMTGFSGPDGSTLITERNKRALEVMAKQLDAGDKRLAIFYGAGHLSEMHDQLEKEFDMKPVSIEWVEAWDLRE